MPKKCRICGFDDGHNFKCPNKTPPKPELKYYPDRFVIDGTTKPDGKRYFAYTIESVDALIEWYDKERSARDIEFAWFETELQELSEKAYAHMSRTDIETKPNKMLERLKEMRK